MALVFTDSNFQTEVLESPVPVVVDFWAAWCRPCHALSSVIDKLHESLTTGKVGKVNVDENEEVTGRYNVSAIPTVLIFKNGEPVERFVGVRTEEVFKEAIEKLL